MQNREYVEVAFEDVQELTIYMNPHNLQTRNINPNGSVCHDYFWAHNLFHLKCIRLAYLRRQMK